MRVLSECRKRIAGKSLQFFFITNKENEKPLRTDMIGLKGFLC